MNRVSKWAILLFSLSLVVSCGTNRPGAITDPTTTDDPSQPVDTSDPSGTTDPADPSNTGTACESDTDCAPGICGEDGTCQPRDLACSSDADCYEDEYCAFPSGSSSTLPLRACAPQDVRDQRDVRLDKSVSMDAASVTTTVIPLQTAATVHQMRSVTAKPEPVTLFQVSAISANSAHVTGSVTATTPA